MFDTAVWSTTPNGYGVHRDDRKPCHCGNRRFEVRSHVYRDRKSGASYRADQVVCPRCMPAAIDDHAIGTLDVIERPKARA